MQTPNKRQAINETKGQRMKKVVVIGIESCPIKRGKFLLIETEEEIIFSFVEWSRTHKTGHTMCENFAKQLGFSGEVKGGGWYDVFKTQICLTAESESYGQFNKTIVLTYADMLGEILEKEVGIDLWQIRV